MNLTAIIERETKKAIGVTIKELVDSLEFEINRRLGFEPAYELPYYEARDNFEKGYIGYLMSACDGNKTRVSEASGLSRKTVIKKTGEYKVYQDYASREISDALEGIKRRYGSILTKQTLGIVDASVEGICNAICVNNKHPLFSDYRQALRYFDRAYLEKNLQGKSIAEAAKLVGLNPRTYSRKFDSGYKKLDVE